MLAGSSGGEGMMAGVRYVEIVELWDTVLGDELRDGGIPLGDPSEELGDTHGCEMGEILGECGVERCWEESS